MTNRCGRNDGQAWPGEPFRRAVRVWQRRRGLEGVVLRCWSSALQEEDAGEADLVSALQAVAVSLEDPGDLDPLLDRIEDAPYVLLGEASHGTSEYYTWRAHLSRRL